MEKNTNIQQALFFPFVKKSGLRNKKVIKVGYLTIVLMKTMLLLFFVFSQYEVACEERTILQISIYNWMQNCIF